MAVKTDVSADLAFLDGKRGEMTARLKDWCAINSGSYNVEGLTRMRAALRACFSELGTEVEEATADRQTTVTAQG